MTSSSVLPSLPEQQAPANQVQPASASSASSVSGSRSSTGSAEEDISRTIGNIDVNLQQGAMSPQLPSPNSGSSPPTPLTPKTPAEEGLDFFSGALQPGEGPIRVYELRLSPDGGPSKDLQVRRAGRRECVSDASPSMFASPQRIRPIFSVYPSKRVLPHPRTACLRQISLSMERHSAGNGMPNGRASSYFPPTSFISDNIRG